MQQPRACLRNTRRAISFVLVGAIGGAFIGPEIATGGQNWINGVPYSGSMIAIAVLYAVQAVLFLALRPASSEYESQQVKTQRSLPDIVRQPVFLVAVLGATAGYGLMTLVMTATPLSMHVNDGYSVEQTANVIRAHVLGMYVPSLVSGFMIERLGVVRMMFVGASGYWPHRSSVSRAVSFTLLVGAGDARRRLEFSVRRRHDDVDLHILDGGAISRPGGQRVSRFRHVGHGFFARRDGHVLLRLESIDVGTNTGSSDCVRSVDRGPQKRTLAWNPIDASSAGA